MQSYHYDLRHTINDIRISVIPMKSIWLHDYTPISDSFGPKFDYDLISKHFDEVFINNTDGLGIKPVSELRKRGLKVYQWILDPQHRTEDIERPILHRDGFILDLEPMFIKKDYPVEELIEKWKIRDDEQVFLCLPAPDYIFLYYIRGYAQLLKNLKKKGVLDKFDRIYVMEYTSYPNTVIKPIWLIDLEIKFLSALTGREIIPIFSIYDWDEPFAKKVINKQIKKYQKLSKLYPNHSIFAWSDPLYEVMKGWEKRGEVRKGI